MLLLLAVLGLAALRVVRSGSLPGMQLAGEDVGGLGRAELTERVEDFTRARASDDIVLERDAAGTAERISETFDRSELGYEIDVEATVDAIFVRGRQGNPFAAFADQVRASFTDIELEPVESIDEDKLTAWVDRVTKTFATPSSPGELTFQGGRVQAVLPAPGVVVDPDELEERARDALDDDLRTISAPVEATEPEISEEAVKAAEQQARRVLADPVTLTRGDETVELSSKQIAGTLVTKQVEEEGETTLQLDVLPGRLKKVAADAFEGLGQTATDATFELGSNGVRIVPGRPGIAVDAKKLAARLIVIATSQDREAPVPVRRVAPEFSTADARDLKIEDQVSTFTTEHSCCEPRVENIHRIADLIDGTVVLPGDTFSLNGAVGERTTAKGFVGAPAIRDGEYVEEVGGGISQFATTLFNAIFFGGYDILEYKAHSYYISRYPMGREATISWPSPDLAFQNDSDSGIYIDTSYSDTSITVTFYGNKTGEVSSRSGSPTNYKDPEKQCEENPDLGKRETNLVQAGSRGFDITVTRVFEGGSEEDFFTRYLPVPEIVEKRKC